jgi:hypothetical protein
LTTELHIQWLALIPTSNTAHRKHDSPHNLEDENKFAQKARHLMDKEAGLTQGIKSSCIERSVLHTNQNMMQLQRKLEILL